MNDTTEKTFLSRHALVIFFILSYALMILGVALTLFLSLDVFYLTISIWSPTIAALIVTVLRGGLPDVKKLLRGFTIWRVSYKWYLAALFLIIGPLIFALIYIMLGFEYVGIDPSFTASAAVVALMSTLYLGPLSEEAGWRGFALPKLQERYSALTSSLILGVIWACWHLPLYLIETRMPFYIYLPLVMVLTILFTWLYNNTKGSLIIAVLAHFCFNFTAIWFVGYLGLLPQMVFYIAGSVMLIPYVVVVIIYFGKSKLSRKPESELPI